MHWVSSSNRNSSSVASLNSLEGLAAPELKRYCLKKHNQSRIDVMYLILYTRVMVQEKAIYWVGTSYKDLLEFPRETKQEAGYQLHRIQNGLDPEDWKPFQSVGSGVKEIRISEDSSIYRIMYVAKFTDRVYVLHSFQKKTQKTRQKDIDIAKARYTAVVKEEK